MVNQIARGPQWPLHGAFHPPLQVGALTNVRVPPIGMRAEVRARQGQAQATNQ